MNKLLIIAAVSVVSLASVAATSAWADDITPDTTASQGFTSTLTRAEVRIDLDKARADGSMATWTAEAAPQRPLAATIALASLTREEIKAAMRVNRDAGLSAAVVGEDSGSFYFSQVQQPGAAGPWMAKASRAGH